MRRSWSSFGRSYALELAGDSVTLLIDRAPAVTLSLAEWNAVRAGLNDLARERAAASGPTDMVDRPLVPNNGKPWTEELDRELCRRWYAGEGLASLAVVLGRTEGGVASRLVRLDCVADRDEARARR
ncbi:hypothetical protein [Sphingomonas lenta]|uniref:Uncharacterized protein n=1 Tax=Sphingomonas lenta TaxID=1141887 RepID=A0A2A2SEF8_9SPHN|nr:hypothetical protein [Sphingomonas lenta]PAX07603.1 hypothetical protein CKY28_08090 [Sphingomonas lenta]